MNPQNLPKTVGQCSGCLHLRRVASARGSDFVLCRRAALEPTFPRYPNLPMSDCPGYEPRAAVED